MRWKKGIALAAAVLMLAGALAGCAKKAVEASAPEDMVSMRNDGREAKLVLGELRLSEERTAVLEEIAQKYRADFPNTDIEIRSFESAEELEAALRQGELDLAEIDSGRQAALVKEGLLKDIYPYLKAWSESATLTPAAKQAACSLGGEHAYLIPNSSAQDMLYYRSDWFDEYNQGLKKGQAACRSWGQIAGEERSGEMVPGVTQKLGDRGRLAFAGKDKLVDYFDAMVWSCLSLGRIADQGAAYFSAADESKTVFSLEKAAEGADEFLRVMQVSALPEAVNWSEEEAVSAFIDGRAGLLVASRSASATLRDSMPEGSWTMAAFPLGRSGSAVFSQEFSGWGVASSTKDLEIAAHFLTFLSNADNNTHYAKVCGVLPIHLEAANMEPSLAEGELSTELEMVSRGTLYQYASQPVMYSAFAGYRDQINEKLRQFVSGELTRDDLLKWLDEYWSAACQKEGKLWK